MFAWTPTNAWLHTINLQVVFLFDFIQTSKATSSPGGNVWTFYFT